MVGCLVDCCCRFCCFCCWCYRPDGDDRPADVHQQLEDVSTYYVQTTTEVREEWGWDRSYIWRDGQREGLWEIRPLGFVCVILPSTLAHFFSLWARCQALMYSDVFV